MIKVENYGKITENSRNLPENSLKKNPKNLPPSFARRIGGPASLDRGGILPIFSMTGGFLADPPFGHAWYKYSITAFLQKSPLFL